MKVGSTFGHDPWKSSHHPEQESQRFINDSRLKVSEKKADYSALDLKELPKWAPQMGVIRLLTR